MIKCNCPIHYNDVIMGAVSSQNTSLTIVLNGWFRRRWKKTSKLGVTGLCAGNSPGTGEFPAQMASNAENVSIWWRHHGKDTSSPRYSVSHTIYGFVVSCFVVFISSILMDLRNACAHNLQGCCTGSDCPSCPRANDVILKDWVRSARN